MKLKNPFLAKSTRQFFEEANTTTSLTTFQKIHAYIYLKWAYLYIRLGTGEHRLVKLFLPLISLFNNLVENKKPDKKAISFADTYHGKVITNQSAKQLVQLNQKIELRDLEKIVPYKAARDIVMNNPDQIAVIDCPCRMARKNPCTPVDVCLIIGEPFVSFTLEHHPTKSRKITAEEAEEILVQEHKRGHVHHAFFKDAMLNRFYAICNCCSCCCGAMQAQRNGTPMLASSGYICRIDIEKCIGCGVCIKKCQFDAIAREKKKKIVINYQKCMGCGACISSCKAGALSLEKDIKKGEPLEILKLLDEAAVTKH